MNALADFSHKFGSQPRELQIGQSFFADNADTVFHTIRYDFVPASIDPNKTSAIDFGENGKVTITMPNVEGSGTTESVYQGQRKPHQKECVLIINNETGDMILERLNQSMIVKKARLRQEDLTGKSLALNNKGLSNGNSSVTSSTNASNVIVSQAKSLNSSDKKLILPSHKSAPPNSSKKQSPPNSTSNSISRPNGMTNNNKTSTNISPPSMPVFLSNNKPTNTAKINSENNSDWKIRMPDPPDPNKLKASTRNNPNNTQQKSSNCLSESSNESSDSEAESSSDHSSDNEDNNEKLNVKINSNPLSAPLSMPSLAPITSAISDSVEASLNDKKNDLSLSEDSDSSSSEEDIGANGIQKSFQIPNNVINTKHSSLETSQSKFNDDPSNSILPSMPKFSQLSQDLQLSESDSDD